jgi:hypothetical protein
MDVFCGPCDIEVLAVDVDEFGGDHGRCPSVFARQKDGVVGEPERDFGNREVGKIERFLEYLVAVAVLASEDAAMAHEINLERPDLKFFGGNALVVGLDEGDFVQQSVSAAAIGDMLGPVREQHVGIDRAAIPVFGAGKVAQTFG